MKSELPSVIGRATLRVNGPEPDPGVNLKPPAPAGTGGVVVAGRLAGGGGALTPPDAASGTEAAGSGLTLSGCGDGCTGPALGGP